MAESEVLGQLQDLGIISAGVLVYALIVNAFYQIISKRVMFKTKAKSWQHPKERQILYLLSFPLISFIFFLLLSTALIFLSDNTVDPVAVFTVAMAIVGAVRVAAYFSEPTSHDLAKMLPLGLLGVFLVRFEFEDLGTSFRQLEAIVEHAKLVGIFFAAVVLLEYVLKIVSIGVEAIWTEPKKKPPQKPSKVPPKY